MLYKQIQKNKQKTALLVTVFTVLVLGMGWGIGYVVNNDSVTGLVITGLILLIYVPLTYATASSQVLALSKAKEIKRTDNAQLFDIVEELCIAARLPMPKIYIVNDPSPNAFATGIKPEKGAIAFTTGLLETLNREELSGVVAHELAHIRNYDIRLMTICIALVGVISLIANVGARLLFFGGRNRGSGQKKGNPIMMIIAIVFVILAPIAAQFVRLAVSRNREYLADATAVEFTRNPTGLINALQKISGDPREVESAQAATAAMYISKPRGKKKQNKTSLWATHPPMAKRIERLHNM